jgi:hypothetical protein
MSYPAPFHKIVMIGNLHSDIFNTTLSVVPTGGFAMPEPSTGLVATVAGLIGSWWDNPLATGVGNGITINQAAVLTSVKLNRIDTAGHYMDNTPHEFTFGTPIVGGGGGVCPPQLTIVASLRGVADRAKAGRGRMYFPPSQLCTSSLAIDGRLTAPNALQYASGVRQLLGQINDAYLAAGLTAVCGIASKAGSGAFQGVSSVAVGRVVDTMRSRRNKDTEAYEVVTM